MNLVEQLEDMRRRCAAAEARIEAAVAYLHTDYIDEDDEKLIAILRGEEP